jgi:hypothetical protein
LFLPKKKKKNENKSKIERTRPKMCDENITANVCAEFGYAQKVATKEAQQVIQAAFVPRFLERSTKWQIDQQSWAN